MNSNKIIKQNKQKKIMEYIKEWVSNNSKYGIPINNIGNNGLNEAKKDLANPTILTFIFIDK